MSDKVNENMNDNINEVKGAIVADIEQGADYNKQRGIVSAIDVPYMEDAVIDDYVEVSKLDSKGRAQATGRRKRSSARVWLSTGKGFSVNGKDVDEYFNNPFLTKYALSPLQATKFESAKIYSTVRGGGLQGQAGALRHAIARALLNFDPTFKHGLKAEKMLTRDDRKKERKTPGFRTARKPQQFSKR